MYLKHALPELLIHEPCGYDHECQTLVQRCWHVRAVCLSRPPTFSGKSRAGTVPSMSVLTGSSCPRKVPCLPSLSTSLLYLYGIFHRILIDTKVLFPLTVSARGSCYLRMGLSSLQVFLFANGKARGTWQRPHTPKGRPDRQARGPCRTYRPNTLEVVVVVGGDRNTILGPLERGKQTRGNYIPLWQASQSLAREVTGGVGNPPFYPSTGIRWKEQWQSRCKSIDSTSANGNKVTQTPR